MEAGREGFTDGFHPLKAGRRPSTPAFKRCGHWQFPSPQGGSETDENGLVTIFRAKFPSPQGGSETKGK